MILKFRGGLLAAVSACALTAVSPSMAQENDQASNQERNQEANAATSRIVAKGAWSKTVTYAKDDIVTARGSAWRSKVANNKNHVPGSTTPNTAAFWEAFAVGFHPTGAWSSGHTYQPNELATYHGQTWRAKLTNKNSSPVAGSKWELLVTKGATGAHGATGATGPQGPTGPAGPNTGVGAGSQSVPAISFNGDANTGIYSPGADKIALVENGALFLHNLGTGNTALGKAALAGGTGPNNTAMGDSALMNNTTGEENSAFGNAALKANTTGQFNTAVGNEALKANNADENTAIGAYAMMTMATGSENVAVGTSALVSNAGGNGNTAVGRGSLAVNQTGSANVAVGTNALSTSTTGSENIAIGYQAGLQAPPTVSNSIYIGNDGLSTGSNTIIIGNSATTTAFMAGISGVTSIGGAAVYINGSGQFGTALSSRRFKQDIEPVTSEAGLLDRLQPVSFRYKQADTDGSMPLQYGLIAEDVEAISRDLVIYGKDGKIQTVKYQFLPPLLLAGYQAQQKTIRTQADEIADLKARLAKIEALLPQTKAASLQ